MRITPVLFFLAAMMLHAQSRLDTALIRDPLKIPPMFKELYARQYGTDSLSVRPGFHVSVFYAGLQRPRFMAFDRKGVLHVACGDAAGIVALPDTDGDGLADSAILVAGGIDSAHGIAFNGDTLFASDPRTVWKLLDTNGDGIYETRSVFATLGDTGYYNHYTRTLLFDKDSNYLYVSVGANCNVCRPADIERGSILRFNADGTGRKIFANGIRNALGMTLNPWTHQLWVTNADRDHLGDQDPHEMITSVPEGAFFGWPLAYGDHTWDNFQNDDEYRALLPITSADSQRVANMKLAELYLSAHNTPQGILFYTGGAFPAGYIGHAFISVHGSSPAGRGIAEGYKVIEIQQDSITGVWSASDFVTGFLTNPYSYQYWGRPSGMIADSAGNLYISSDVGIGAIYKITYAEPQSRVPSIVERSAAALAVTPNPVRKSGAHSSITYTLKKGGRITLSLFDVKGRAVRTLLHDEWRTAGVYSLDYPADLAAGSYICRLSIGKGMSSERTIATKVIVQ